MQEQTTSADVDERDVQTIQGLEEADEAIQAVLKLMPNDKRSVFDPANDVPALMTALDRVRLVLRCAIETRQDRRRP